MGIKDAIETGRQVRIEMAMLDAESRILGYDGKIFAEMGVGFRKFGKALAAPFRGLGALFFGVSTTHDEFDARVAQEKAQLDATLRVKHAEWEKTSGATETYALDKSIHDGLESSIKEANITAEAGSMFWRGKILDSMGMSRRARFERLYRENVIDPEAGERRRAGEITAATSGGFAAGIAAGSASRDDSLSR